MIWFSKVTGIAGKPATCHQEFSALSWNLELRENIPVEGCSLWCCRLSPVFPVSLGVSGGDPESGPGELRQDNWMCGPRDVCLNWIQNPKHLQPLLRGHAVFSFTPWLYIGPSTQERRQIFTQVCVQILFIGVFSWTFGKRKRFRGFVLLCA